MTAGDCIKIAGIEVILWPDADQPGLKQAKVAAELLHQSGQPRLIRICALPLELPVSGDIVDAVKMLGWTASDIRVLCSTPSSTPPIRNPRELDCPRSQPKGRSGCGSIEFRGAQLQSLTVIQAQENRRWL